MFETMQMPFQSDVFAAVPVVNVKAPSLYSQASMYDYLSLVTTSP